MPKVKFQNTGEEVEVEQGANLKEVTKNQGWSIPYGCEEGTCGTCIIKVIEGKENFSPLTETEKQTLDVMSMDDGEHRLACQCKVNGDVTIEGM